MHCLDLRFDANGLGWHPSRSRLGCALPAELGQQRVAVGVRRLVAVAFSTPALENRGHLRRENFGQGVEDELGW